MANRPVFLPMEDAPFYRAVDVSFPYSAGFAPSQKRKNIAAIHEAFSKVLPGAAVLEISSKSLQPEGVLLSAFSLKKFVPSLGSPVSVENVYQAGKVFSEGGPFTDLLLVSPREAKRDPRLAESGPLVGFRFQEQFVPASDGYGFYNWIYLSALMENPELLEAVSQYDAFTDIEYNPRKSANCQARAAAVAVSLMTAGKDIFRRGTLSYEEFKELTER